MARKGSVASTMPFFESFVEALESPHDFPQSLVDNDYNNRNRRLLQEQVHQRAQKIFCPELLADVYIWELYRRDEGKCFPPCSPMASTNGRQVISMPVFGMETPL